MHILTILIAVIIDRFADGLVERRRFGAFIAMTEVLGSMASGLFTGTFGLLVAIAIPVVVAGWLQGLFAHGFFGLPGFVFGLIVLLFCLGPRDLPADVDAYCQARHNDADSVARQCAARIGNVRGDDDALLDRAVVDGIFARALSTVFSVVFWFLVLGPLGAVLYRTARVIAEQSNNLIDSDMQGSAMTLVGILDWIPARLAALAYAMSGHFNGALSAWRESVHHEHEIENGSSELLVSVGNGALGISGQNDVGLTEVDEAMDMVWRAVIVWLVVMAVMVLAGWID